MPPWTAPKNSSSIAQVVVRFPGIVTLQESGEFVGVMVLKSSAFAHKLLAARRGPARGPGR